MLIAMSVRGALSTMTAEDVLEWAAKRRLSAPIAFERRSVTRSVVVEDGQVMWASSNRRDEQLGVILVRSGIVAERALADSLEARAETGVPLGKVLLMAGMITESALIDILATKIRETITDVVTWTEGTFEVVPRGQIASTGVATPLAMEQCLALARKRYQRMTDIMAVLGSDDVTFYVPPAATPPEPVAGLDVNKIWTLAGDRHTAADIAAAFHGDRYAVYDALSNMVAFDRLVIDRRHRERTNSAVELAAGARGRLRAGDRAGAYAMAAQALHQDPSDAEVRKTFAQVERARVAEVAKQLLSRHRVPKRGVPPTPDMGLSTAELELASRVDGRWDLLSLVRSANVREAEALLAFSRLAEAGVVVLGT